MIFTELNILLNETKRLFKMNRVDGSAVSDAIKDVSAALIDTEYYLNSQYGNFVANKELAHKWNHAAAAARKVDPQMGDIFSTKSNFWLNPKKYGVGQGYEVADLEKVKRTIRDLRAMLDY